jgi:hypothetical protein
MGSVPSPEDCDILMFDILEEINNRFQFKHKIYCLLCSVFSKWWLVYAARTNTDVCARNYLYPVFLLKKNATMWVLSMNFVQRHASPWLTGWPSTRIRLCCVLSAFIINKSKTMESKGYKKTFKIKCRKNNKAAENGKIIAYNYTATCIMCAVWYIMQDIWTGVLCHLWLLYGYF